ncbi:hypothetical protein DRP53_04590 [candidate division WOR-3 bacterium]|uniref:Secretion system C-terminal sorting domain-containing protein n=1 Tax=candidate division WOR-3 bacterium TaxID=2052148 RepID=A0A660SJ58_UNCW3|nr:MAG: hypothetical protein DRP53_04590 [candidate division WOR-3 bacterium]
MHIRGYGGWNWYNFDPPINDEDGRFWFFYIQENPYPYCTQLCCDDSVDYPEVWYVPRSRTPTNITISIYDPTGRLVYQRDKIITAGSRHLPVGLYFVRLASRHEVNRFIIVH